MAAHLRVMVLPDRKTEFIDPAADESLEHLLDDFHARQILHVTFGSVLTARDDKGTLRFGDHLMALLREHPDAYARNLERHFRRHLLPFAQQTT